MAVTPNFSLPLYTTADLAKLDTLLNGQSTALDTNLKTVIDNIGYGAGLHAARPATPPNGFTWYSTDTNVLWRYRSGAWGLFGFGPFKATQASSTGGGTVSSGGSMGALTGVSLTQAITTGVACRAKLTLNFKFSGNAVGTGAYLGVKCTGATTITPLDTDATSIQVLQQAVNQTNTYSSSWIVSLNAGTTTLALVGQAIGVGGVRSLAHPVLLVEPVSE